MAGAGTRALIWKGALVAASAVAALVVAGATRSQPDPAIERGRYLAILGDCEGCHTAPGSPALSGGLGLNTPFGTIHSTNITPDNDTGIGRWTREQFRRAMKTGKRADGANLYPAMPYPYYARASDADIDAIYDHLKTVPPVHASARANALPFPFNVRALVTAWNGLNFKRPFKVPYKPSPEWLRGYDLVDGLGHCGACHTPKTALGGDRWEKALKGGEVDDWFAPSLTGEARTGLKSWSVEDVALYLKTGANSRATAGGSMKEVVEHSTSKLSDADLHAVGVYLKSLPEAPARPLPKPPGRQAMRSGKAIYLDTCVACHSPDGGGVPGAFPPLKDNPAVQQANATSVVHTLLAGGRSVAGPEMPGYAATLTDYEIAAVANYVRNSWGNAADPVESAKVARLRVKVARHPVRLGAGNH